MLSVATTSSAVIDVLLIILTVPTLSLSLPLDE